MSGFTKTPDEFWGAIYKADLTRDEIRVLMLATEKRLRYGNEVFPFGVKYLVDSLGLAASSAKRVLGSFRKNNILRLEKQGMRAGDVSEYSLNLEFSTWFETSITDETSIKRKTSEISETGIRNETSTGTTGETSQNDSKAEETQQESEESETGITDETSIRNETQYSDIIHNSNSDISDNPEEFLFQVYRMLVQEAAEYKPLIARLSERKRTLLKAEEYEAILNDPQSIRYAADHLDISTALIVEYIKAIRDYQKKRYGDLISTIRNWFTGDMGRGYDPIMKYRLPKGTPLTRQQELGKAPGGGKAAGDNWAEREKQKTLELAGRYGHIFKPI